MMGEGESMAGIKLVIDLEPDRALPLAWRAAEDLGFALTPIQDGTFQASKGYAILSVLVGPLAPHCRFQISARRYEDGTTDLVIERNGAMTSGAIGARRIKGEADALMDKIAAALEANGGKVRERREI
jgi:hypothetical protein